MVPFYIFEFRPGDCDITIFVVGSLFITIWTIAFLDIWVGHNTLFYMLRNMSHSRIIQDKVNPRVSPRPKASQLIREELLYRFLP